MTEPVKNPIDQYVVVGGESTFLYTFKIAAKGELDVFKLASGTITKLVVDVGYTVQGVGTAGGSTITPIGSETPVTAGNVWSILRNGAISSVDDFTISGGFLAATINAKLDKLTRILQDVNRDVDFSIKPDPALNSTLVSLIPAPINRRALVLREVTTGNFDLIMSATDPDTAGASNTGYMNTVVQLSADTTLTISQQGNLVVVDTSAAVRNITLPVSTSLAADFRVAIVQGPSASNSVNVKRSGSDTINGSASDIVLSTQWKILHFVLDKSGATWIASNVA